MNGSKILVILFLLLLGRSLYSEVWIRGAAVVLKADGDVGVAVRGTDLDFHSFEQPIYFPGVFSSDIRGAGSAFFYTSNGVALSFSGAGVFSVDRFEILTSDEVEGGRNLGENLGHMILNLRRGKLLIDNRALSENSKFLVETPVGRVSFLKGVFLLEVIHDSGSSLYNFSIACAQGTARYTGFDNEPYLIYAGQQVAGSGKHSSPSVGIRAQSGPVREQLMNFTEVLNALDETLINQKELLSHESELRSPDKSFLQALPQIVPESQNSHTRPIIIEYSSRSEPISPLRVEVRSPDQSSQNLFTPIN